MPTTRWILFLLSLVTLAVLAGCGGINTYNTQNPPPPPASKLAISVQTVPAATADGQPVPVLVNGTMTLTATVTNDPNNYGVDWNLTCPAQYSISNNCGTLSATHTGCAPSDASCNTGQNSYTTSVSYTPPASLYGNTQPASIVAYATANHAANVQTLISPTGFDSNLKPGNYVLQAQGVEDGQPYQFVGVITLGTDNNGNLTITGGEQTVNFYDQALTAPGLVSKTETIIPSEGSIPAGCIPTTTGSFPTPSDYFLGPDGRGTMIINTGDPDIGYNTATPCVETFTFVFLNNSHALISQMDIPQPGNWQGASPPTIAATGASAAGTMDLQTTTAALTGGYAFVVSGIDSTGAVPQALGGVFTIDTGGLSFCGTASSTKNCMIDQVFYPAAGAGVVNLDKSLSGTVTSPDSSFGKVTLNLTAGFDPTNPSAIVFTGYIVDSTHMKLIESDLDPASGVQPFAATAGVAIAQAPPSGGFTEASFSGPYAFGVTGVDLENTNVPLSPATLTSAGTFYASGAGKLGNGSTPNGNFMDTLLQSNTSQENLCNQKTGVCNSTNPGAQFSTPFDGQYFGAPLKLGRVVSAFKDFVVPAGFGRYPNFSFLFYLTGNGGYGNENCPNNSSDKGNCPVLALAYADITTPSSVASVYPFLGTGIAYPQAPSPTFPDITPDAGGRYGFSFTQFGSSGENDGTAQMTAPTAAVPPPAIPGCVAGSTTASLSLSGCADINVAGFSSLAQPFSGQYSQVTNGSFQGTLVGINSSNNQSSSAAFSTPIETDYYVIDQDHGFFIETDLLSGPSGQVSFGYYAPRSQLQCPTGFPNCTTY